VTWYCREKKLKEPKDIARCESGAYNDERDGSCDTRHRDNEIQSRVALHKRKHILFLLRGDPILEHAERASGFDASRPNLIMVEIYTAGTTALAKSEWKRQREWLHFADFSRLSLTS